VRTLTAKLAAAEGQLTAARSKALVDPLTEVANRRGFDITLAQRIEEADVTTPVVLALFDVDEFKAINDGFGHPTGDAILRHVAVSIRDSVRQEDLVARIGGDEFAFVATGLTLAQAASRLRATVQAIASGTFGADGVKVSVSCGASEFSAGDTVQTLMQRTDAALADAKALGKNRVVTRNVPLIRNLIRPRR
jgi:diguanylate cyclase